MIARLLLCMAFVFPMVVGACEGDKKDEMLKSYFAAKEERFTTNENKEKDKEEDKERLASKEEGKDLHNFLLTDEKIQESIV